MRYIEYNPGVPNYESAPISNILTTAKFAEMCPDVVVPSDRPSYKRFCIQGKWMFKQEDTKRYLTAGIGTTNRHTERTGYSPGGNRVMWSLLPYDYYHVNNITIDPNVIITVGNSIFKTKQTTLGVENLDTGTAFTIGIDYYVYICDPTNGDDTIDQDEEYVISANSTYPVGWNESNSRKIGGFHYGRVRKIDIFGKPYGVYDNSDEDLTYWFWYDPQETDYFYFQMHGGNQYIYMDTSDGDDTLDPIYDRSFYIGSKVNWKANVYVGIVPNSVWTLLHRPISDPEGMVYLGNNLWGDIYLASDNGLNGLASKYNQTPINSALDWYGFIEKANVVRKRLPTYEEYIRAAYGSPTGANNNTYAFTNNNGNSANKNVGKTGSVANAVSAYNVCDLVGRAYKWLSNVMDVTAPVTTRAWTTAITGLNGDACGMIYGPKNTSLKALYTGGTYNSSTNAGRRTLLVNQPPTLKNAAFGGWLVSPSISYHKDGVYGI